MLLQANGRGTNQVALDAQDVAVAAGVVQDRLDARPFARSAHTGCCRAHPCAGPWAVGNVDGVDTEVTQLFALPRSHCEQSNALGRNDLHQRAEGAPRRSGHRCFERSCSGGGSTLPLRSATIFCRLDAVLNGFSDACRPALPAHASAPRMAARMCLPAWCRSSHRSKACACLHESLTRKACHVLGRVHVDGCDRRPTRGVPSLGMATSGRCVTLAACVRSRCQHNRLGRRCSCSRRQLAPLPP